MKTAHGWSELHPAHYNEESPMNIKNPDQEAINGRFQMATSAAEGFQIVAVLDTATGKLWVKEVLRGIGGDKSLLKAENQGKCIWEMD
jgi:hypothetical protein